MRKRIIVALLLVATVAFAANGCQAMSKIDTDEVTVSGYKGIEIDKVDAVQKIADKDVTAAIDQTREQNATSTEIKDRAVKKGDVTTIDFVGKMDGKAFDGGSSQDYQLEIGSNSFIEGFEDSIIGHKIGDKFDWSGKFPADYQNADMAGKAVTFTITVKGIAEKKVPELNDEFVKKVSEKSKTVKEYKAEIKKQLEDQAKLSHEDSLYGAVMDAVLKKAKVKKYDTEEIDKQVEQYIAQYKSQAEAAGTDLATFAKQNWGFESEDALKKELETQIKSSQKDDIVVSAIAKKEKISPDKDEQKELGEYIAKAQGMALKDLKTQYGEETVDKAVKRLAVMQWLSKYAVQVEKSDDSKSSSK